MTPKDHSRIVLPVLTGLLVLGVVAACLFGSTTLSPMAVLQTLFGLGSPGEQIVVWEIRLPRALAALLTGAALGMSGAAMQGLLRNPLAEPGVLGVSATASLGAVVSIYFGLSAIWAPMTPILTIAMALAASAFLAFVAQRVGSVVTLILVGVGLSSFAGSILSLLMSIAPNPFTLSDMVTWMLGSVANRSFDDIGLSLPFMLVGAVMLFRARPALRALTFGEEAAAGLGVDVKKARLLIVVGCAMATGAAVALAGTIAFVGIIVPHLVRPLVGHDPGRTLLPAALAGGLILVLADIVVRLLPTDSELRLGVIAALLGAPIFIWIALRRPVSGEPA